MNYPPANVWTKLEPEIEQRVECEPALVDVGHWLSLPADWDPARREAFMRRWIGSDALLAISA